MKSVTQMVLAAMFVLLAGSQSWAIEASFEQENVLNGTTIHYRYVHGWEYEIRFYDNMLQYTSLANFRKVMGQDKNKDGKVTRDEFSAEPISIPADLTLTPLVEKRFSKEDRNGDRTITEDEQFANNDKNGDGVIEEHEARPTEPGNKDIPYHVKQIGDNMYAVFWHEPDLNIVTLIINFNTSTLYGFGVVAYADKPFAEEFFHGAIIQAVKRD